MVYLIDPQGLGKKPPCKTLCYPVFCAIKPLYGIEP